MMDGEGLRFGGFEQRSGEQTIYGGRGCYRPGVDFGKWIFGVEERGWGLTPATMTLLRTDIAG